MPDFKYDIHDRVYHVTDNSHYNQGLFIHGRYIYQTKDSDNLYCNNIMYRTRTSQGNVVDYIEEELTAGKTDDDVIF